MIITLNILNNFEDNFFNWFRYHLHENHKAIKIVPSIIGPKLICLRLSGEINFYSNLLSPFTSITLAPDHHFLFKLVLHFLMRYVKKQVF